MDDITRRVSEMYARFPYPSPNARGRRLTELANLLSLFSLEAGYDFRGKRILDAGTGTGHRLIAAAASLPEAQFTAVDISEIPLRIARETAAHEGVRNVEFRVANVLDDGKTIGTFDVALGMGVIHHLSDPPAGVRNLVGHLVDDGLLFLWVYGRHGSQERLRRKQIVSLLRGTASSDFEEGIRLVRALNFDSPDYGWHHQVDDEASRDALIVDAYLNVNETAFDFDGIMALMRASGLHGFVVYGITTENFGSLVDTRISKARGVLPVTDVAAQLPSPLLQAAYERLSLIDRYRLIDLMFRPNGYTILGFTEHAWRRVPPDTRIGANAVILAHA